jgi:hypothetical protein
LTVANCYRKINKITYLPLLTSPSGKLVKEVGKIGNIIKLADHSGSVFRTRDLRNLGLTPYAIRKLLRNKAIERIKPGYYRLYTDQDTSSEATLIANLFPDGVLCMYTAMFYYGYSDRTPLEWDIAIDKDTSKSRFKLDYPFVKPYYMEGAMLSFGVTMADYEDCQLKIFDRDRLICETIFFESKIDKESYNKAIQAYINDSKKNIPNLIAYSIKRRIPNKVKDRIGVWL